MLRRLLQNYLRTGTHGVFCALLLLAASCGKYTDEPGKTDPRLSRKYCNDPEAVNYNRDFPGTADNSVCYYPADVFKGQFAFIDSIYDGNKRLAEQPLVLNFAALDRVKISMVGFCPGSASTITFKANRQLRAVADTVVLNGQLLCRPKDTVSGYITQSYSDSSRIRFFLTVVSDTGTTFHQGTAYRQ